MSSERLIITLAAIIMAVAFPYSFRHYLQQRWRYLLLTTPTLTILLIVYYNLRINNPSHGVSILLLPLASGYLLFRRQQTGKPQLSPGVFALLQFGFMILYIFVVWLQEQ